MKNQSSTDERFVHQQKRKLLVEQSRISKELKKDNIFPKYGQSEEDNTAEVTDFTQNKGIQKKLNQELKDVKTALKKIENHGYGKCVKCKKQIPIARLDALPSARYCLDCNK